MKNKPENPQAFPLLYRQNAATLSYHDGMTLRDYFAAKAMQTVMSHKDYKFPSDAIDGGAKECSRRAYIVSDAMLTERSKSNE